MKCDMCQHEMIYKTEQRKITFEGMDYPYVDEYYECPKCGDCLSLVNHENEIHSGINRKIKSDYGLIQSDEITRRRIDCGIGIYKFWYAKLKPIFSIYSNYWMVEGGVIQTREQDKAIRQALNEIEAETAGRRKFPLWMYGQDFSNEIGPQRLCWAIEMLCLDKPTAEEELYKKLIYFDSKNNNYTHAKYTSYRNNFRLVYGNVILDYMVNVRKTLKIETINGVDCFVSVNEPEYPAFEHDIVAECYYEQYKGQRQKHLEMLRNKNKIILRLEGNYFEQGWHGAYQYSFKDIQEDKNG